MRMILLIVASLVAMGTCHSRTLKPTIYDDGKSCPGGCDAHVVFAASENGTQWAHKPGTRQHPAACEAGQSCSICFDDTPASCMDVLYRGGGPEPGRFDFTPAFYDQTCGRPGIPQVLVNECTSQAASIVENRYDSAINCFRTPEHPKCAAMMTAARQAQAADEPKRASCQRLGEDRYNRMQADAKQRRTYGCDYSLLLLGGSPSHRWHLLLPGACRPGTAVGSGG